MESVTSLRGARVSSRRGVDQSFGSHARGGRKSVIPLSLWLPDGLPYRRHETITMQVSDWENIPSNPRQRNEVVRIQQNRVGHLVQHVEKHREVAMAELPDGRRYKVDGHTRAAMWKAGLSTPPDSLTVDVYRCASVADVENLYDTFDNSAAMESGTDRVTGAYREAGIAPLSPLLLEGGISTAVRDLYHFLSRTQPRKETKNDIINRAVNMFAAEIMMLDDVKPTRAMFPAGIVMGALLTLSGDKKTAKTFWRVYAESAGTQINGRMDAVEALAKRRGSFIGRASSTVSIKLMNYSVAAVHGFRKGTTYDTKGGISEKAKPALRKYADAVVAAKTGV